MNDFMTETCMGKENYRFANLVGKRMTPESGMLLSVKENMAPVKMIYFFGWGMKALARTNCQLASRFFKSDFPN